MNIQEAYEIVIQEAAKGSTEELSIGDNVIARDPNKSTYGHMMTVNKIKDGVYHLGGPNYIDQPYQRQHIQFISTNKK